VHPLAGHFLDRDYTISGFLTIEARQGLRLLGASEPGAPDLSRPAGRSDAGVLRGDGTAAIVARPIGGGIPLTLSAHLEAQWVDQPLLAYEQVAIGNLTIGRGYDPGAASGDQLVGGEVKLQGGPLQFVKTLLIAPYVFDDWIRIDDLGADAANFTLRSVGAGIGLRGPHGLRADIAYAKPLDKVNVSDLSKPPARVLFQLVFSR